MGHGILLGALIVTMVVDGGSCRTIDEVILSAQGNSSYAEVPSNAVRVELDMMFGTDEYQEILRLDKEAEVGEGQGQRMKRKAGRDITWRWPNNTIPYKIISDFSEAELAKIQAAVDEWNQYTCLYIRPYMSGDDNYVRVTDGEGCSAYVGMHEESKNLTLAKGCRMKGTILHEFGHVLGFFHEQSRPDRDRYVQIMNGSIEEGMEHNFRRHSDVIINTYGVPYDYLSIMHYGKTAGQKPVRNLPVRKLHTQNCITVYFGVNGTQTIRTLDPKYEDLIGNKEALTFNDIKLANLMYQCANHCSPKTCPGEGFVGKDCKCYCPGNPYTLCGFRRRYFTILQYLFWYRCLLERALLGSCVRYCAGDPDCVALTWRLSSKQRCRSQYKTPGACDVFDLSGYGGNRRAQRLVEWLRIGGIS